MSGCIGQLLNGSKSLLLLLFLCIVGGNGVAGRAQLRDIHNLLGDAAGDAHEQASIDGGLKQWVICGPVLPDKQQQVGKFRAHAEVAKEPVVLVEPLDEKVAIFVAGLALVVMLSQGQAGVHLTPVRAYVKQTEE